MKTNPTRLLTPAQVAAALEVDPKTVTRWAKAGKVPAAMIVTTPGGHRRYKAEWLDSILNPAAQA